MAIALVSAARLSAELRGRPESEYQDLQRKVEEATAIVLNYIDDDRSELATASPAEWDETTTPVNVQAAILQVAVNLYAHRGDDDGTVEGPITMRVRNLLRRYRTEAIG
jgi:hypothetical protein